MDHFYISVTIFSACVAVGLMMLSFEGQYLKKMIILGMLAIMGVFSYRAFNDLYGLPQVLTSTIEDAKVYGIFIEDDKKNIFIWAKKESEDSPKAYKLPYSQDLSESLQRRQTRNQGRPFRLKIEAKTRGAQNRFEKIVEEVTISDVEVLPPKTVIKQRNER